ncbi:universal stress protein [Aurantiacibacter sediminis]|uniref:Universal stress protein n=1 Tax=Aurantiacibacter sediminis TaxID=2793064 RepID=A0ABS0MZD3_9SPHN|nr:universal stress protein [Aurantiacibacter sediminis]MBH5321068.1 universal stress protein [Aurantiacibacter sediminis]
MSGPIIAGTDFGPRADRAIDRAIALGEQLGREVIVFHARDLPPYSTDDGHDLDAQLREVLPRGAQGVQFAYKSGSPPHAIGEYADEKNAELIVLGVARHNSIGDYFLGTAVDNCIRRTDLPVLVVKKRPQREYETIAIATDFSEFSVRAARWAAEMFPDAKLHLLHAFHVPYAAWNNAAYVTEEISGYAREKMDEFMKALPDEVQSRITTHVEKGMLTSAINTLIAREGIDLVVLGSHGETGFRHATIGSQANSLLTSSIADTVIIGPRVAD